MDPNTAIKALAEATCKYSLERQFLQTGVIVLCPDTNKELPAGELHIPDCVSSEHHTAIQIKDWTFCINTLTPIGKKMQPHVPENEGVIAGYHEDNFYAFCAIKIDTDPRNAYIDWIAKNIYPLLK